MNDAVQMTILGALFRLSRDTLPISAASLARAAGTTPTCAAHALVELERQGLVDASRARLTMLGLARAVSHANASGAPARERAQCGPTTRSAASSTPVAACPIG